MTASILHQEEFNNLNTVRQCTRPIYELSLWPDLVPNSEHHVSSYEYWPLGALLNMFSPIDKSKYTSQITLNSVLTDNTPKELAPKNSKDISELINRHIYIPNNSNDIELSRYACWILMKEMETNTTFFQEYFMNPNASLTDINKASYHTTRILLRTKLTKLNTQLNGILHSVGANHSSQFATYNREKTEALFGNKAKVNLIKNGHLLPNVNIPKCDTLATPSNTHLSDYMNANLLYMYISAIQNIISKWDELNYTYRNYPTLRNITYNELNRTRRTFIKKYESTPEENLSSYGLKTIEYNQRMRELEFARKYINSHIK